MPNGLSTFAMHTAVQAPPASLRPEIDTATRDASGKTDLAALDPETVARHYLRNALAAPELPTLSAPAINGQESDFKPLGVETLSFANTRTVKFRQFAQRVPIYGSLVTVELDEKHELVSLSSALGSPQNVDAVATIAPTQALQVARDHAGYTATQPLAVTPRLYFYYDQKAERWRLVYVIEDVLKVQTTGDSALPEVVDYVVDAHSGQLVDELPRTQTADEESITENPVDGLGKERPVQVLRKASGAKRLHDRDHNIHTHDFNFRDTRFEWFLLPGKYVENPPEPWEKGAVSAHANSAEVVTFLKQVLQRNGLDNQGGKIVSSINCLRAGQSTGKEWRNAARIPGQMIYGQRLVDGQLVSYAVAKDVVAHELLHGLTDHTARLEYRFESGALNESYSDIFGIIISNFDQPNIDGWNWQMGEDLSDSGLPLRDLRDPRRHNQPDHMDDYVDLPEDDDHGGVHTNSGIHNKAAFNILTAKDGQGNHLFDAIMVARIFYMALSQQLSRTSTFIDSRRGVLLSAATLFRTDPQRDQRLAAINGAFNDVGIL